MIQPRARCLIIQLARLGDTVQSLMAIRAAKQLYPDVDFYLVVREKFSSAAKAVPWLTGVIELPTQSILTPILSDPQSESMQTESVAQLAQWLSPLAAYRWDFVLNWTFSEASSYLTAILPAKVKLGYSRQKDLSLSALDGWSQYIQAIVQGGVPQNIHLTDIFTTQLLTVLQINLGEPSQVDSEVPYSKSFFRINDRKADQWLPQGCSQFIGIQMGASRKEKTWDPANWATWIAMTLKRRPEIGFVLLGGTDDRAAESELLSELSRVGQDLDGTSKNRVVSAVGKVDFETWTSLISRCQWLISADTAAIHIASVLGVRVLNLSLGPVRLEETGPYGTGHIVVRSDLPCEACNVRGSVDLEHTCRDEVSPEAIYAVWEYYHSSMMAGSLEDYFQALGFHPEVGSIQVYRSKVRNGDEGGGVVYEPVFHRPLSTEAWFGQVMGFVARTWYCGWVPPVGHELIREKITPQLLKNLRGLDETCDVLYRVCQQTQRVASELKLKSSSLRSDKIMGIEDKQDLQALGKKLIELEALMERLAKAQPLLKAFSQLSRVLMHNLDGDRLADLGKQTMEAYRQLATGVAIVQEWAKKTVGLVKPAVVQEPTSNLQNLN